jgi:hypothetical protein
MLEFKAKFKAEISTLSVKDNIINNIIWICFKDNVYG